jgi:osmotically-inducible protein OsmY
MKSLFGNRAAAVALAGLLAIAPVAVASNSPAGVNDAAIQAQLAQKLQQKSEFKNVQSAVENGTVTLNGSVETYKQKLDAEKLARKSGKQVGNVRDLIEVSSNVPDAQLRKKLANSLAYDRVGYGDVPFSALTLDVTNGVVTLGGPMADYPTYNDALSLAANTKGVKQVVNNMKVLPVSGMDDNLRWRLFRAIYGDNVLSKYGSDPTKPIRIVVDNGHIALYGQVQSQAEVNIAGIRANGVFGGFSVENHLTTGATDVVK